jgi:hypothetical protein
MSLSVLETNGVWFENGADEMQWEESKVEKWGQILEIAWEGFNCGNQPGARAAVESCLLNKQIGKISRST